MTELTRVTQRTMTPSNFHRTALVPVFKLPEDILLDIFLIIRDSSNHMSEDWYQITQICGYWRRLAVASPSLWTRLHNTPHALIPLMLERSQTAPLDVHFSSLDFKHSTKTLTTIFHEIERIRTLTFDLMEPNFLDTVYDVLTSLCRDWEAYLLESLTIGTFGEESRSASVKLAMDLFRPTRLLRRLSLIGVNYDWNMLPLPNLTHLDLRGQSLGKVSAAHFIETLRDMQHLEVLGVNWKMVDLCQFPPTPRPHPIHLPCLQRLEIWDGYPVHIESFLSLVTHPKLHQLTVDTFSPVTNIVAFAESVLPSIGKGNFSPLEFLNIAFDDDIIITISAKHWSSYYGGSFIHMFTVIDEEVLYDIDDGGNFDFLVDIMSCITSLDCPDKIPLRHLCLENWDAPIDEFTRLFAFLPHLETIEVDQQLASPLFRALNIASASDSASPIPLPRLRSITWNGNWIHNNDGSVPMLSAAVFNDLYSGLLSRHAYGTAITMLNLVGCPRLDEIQVNQLGEIGVELNVE